MARAGSATAALFDIVLTLALILLLLRLLILGEQQAICCWRAAVCAAVPLLDCSIGAGLCPRPPISAALLVCSRTDTALTGRGPRTSLAARCLGRRSGRSIGFRGGRTCQPRGGSCGGGGGSSSSGAVDVLNTLYDTLSIPDYLGKLCRPFDGEKRWGQGRRPRALLERPRTFNEAIRRTSSQGSLD